MVTTQSEETEQSDDARLEEAFRYVIAGHPQGAVRRIVLYVAVALGLTLTAAFGVLGLAVALPALFLLATTDQLV